MAKGDEKMNILQQLYYNIMPDILSDNAPPFGLYNYTYYLIRPWRYLEHIFYEAKYFLQRSCRGFSERDIWGWCDYMAKINIVALRYLAAGKQGHPIGMTMKGWRTRLLKMVDGFEAMLENDNDYTSYKRLSRKDYLALIRSRNRRLTNGLKLWALHFRNLWD